MNGNFRRNIFSLSISCQKPHKKFRVFSKRLASIKKNETKKVKHKVNFRTSSQKSNENFYRQNLFKEIEEKIDRSFVRFSEFFRKVCIFVFIIEVRNTEKAFEYYLHWYTRNIENLNFAKFFLFCIKNSYFLTIKTSLENSLNWLYLTV